MQDNICNGRQHDDTTKFHPLDDRDNIHTEWTRELSLPKVPRCPLKKSNKTQRLSSTVLLVDYLILGLGTDASAMGREERRIRSFKFRKLFPSAAYHVHVETSRDLGTARIRGPQPESQHSVSTGIASLVLPNSGNGSRIIAIVGYTR